MNTVTDVIGVMDPNGYSFRATFERLIEFIHPEIPFGGKLHRVKTQRITTRPYDVLNAKCPYSAIINRGAHWNPHQNSYFMTIGHQTYLLNDMASFNAIDKNVSYGHMYQLGFHIPMTIALPKQDNEEIHNDPRAIPELIFSEHEWFDLEEIGKAVGYPAYLKPQAGGGWIGVRQVENARQLIEAYNASGNKPMNLQKAVEYKEFVRTVGIGPQMLPMHYNPNARFSHDRYLRSDKQAVEFNFLSEEARDEVEKITKVINAFYGWDHNSCEVLLGTDGICQPIDFANAYPDSSLISLHYYFPEVVKCMVRWMLFCAITKKKKSFHFARDWEKYFALAKSKGLRYQERLNAYAQIADEHFETEKFDCFCQRELVDFDEKAFDFFASEQFDDILEREVRYYFKLAQEIPEKLDHYRGLHQFWLDCEKKRLRRE